MLFANNCDQFNLDLDLSSSRRKELIKLSSLFSYKSEDQDLSLHSYIEDLGLDSEIEIGFFDKLKTPSDELKPFDIVEDLSSRIEEEKMDYQHVPSLSSIVKGEKEQKLRLQMGPFINDSLKTPIVDLDSSLAPNESSIFGTGCDVESLLCNSSEEMCTNFPTSNETSTTTNSSHCDSSSITSKVEQVSRLNMNFDPFSSSVTNTNSSVVASNNSNQQDTMPTYCIPTFTSFNHVNESPETSYSCSSLTPSSSTSSMTYTELKPRSYSSTSDLVPTVIDDHPYHSKPISSPLTRCSFSAPSPSPSTSSLASNSTIDTKDGLKNLAALHLDTDDKFMMMRKRNNDASKKSRLTKREKFLKMVDEENKLKAENEALKITARDLEKQVAILKDYVSNIIATAARQS